MTLIGALTLLVLVLIGVRLLRFLAWLAVVFLLGGCLLGTHAFPFWTHGFFLDPTRLLWFLVR